MKIQWSILLKACWHTMTQYVTTHDGLRNMISAATFNVRYEIEELRFEQDSKLHIVVFAKMKAAKDIYNTNNIQGREIRRNLSEDFVGKRVQAFTVHTRRFCRKMSARIHSSHSIFQTLLIPLLKSIRLHQQKITKLTSKECLMECLHYT